MVFGDFFLNFRLLRYFDKAFIDRTQRSSIVHVKVSKIEQSLCNNFGYGHSSFHYRQNKNILILIVSGFLDQLEISSCTTFNTI